MKRISQGKRQTNLKARIQGHQFVYFMVVKGQPVQICRQLAKAVFEGNV
ncbi:hypothetical protein [Photobacterium sp. 1_MG-2023]|nr:hypothetical protein [Photobacterium sp. 1_MG-2023]MDO6707955.1 hypothetical protein [Photobacterium sp. 1_MG-2023]